LFKLKPEQFARSCAWRRAHELRVASRASGGRFSVPRLALICSRARLTWLSFDGDAFELGEVFVFVEFVELGELPLVFVWFATKPPPE
jgi:hypothetical protein